MPAVSFGTYLIKPADAKEATLAAFRAGYRAVDTAEGYRNETEVGAAIAASGIPRGELFVTTKVFPGNPGPVKDFAATKAACVTSLAKLGLAFVDLYLIHAPFAGKAGRLAQWRALLELKAEGKCKAVGVSNFSKGMIEEIVAAGLELPSCNQIELHPLCQRKDLCAWMCASKILPVAYSSLAPMSTWRPGVTQNKTLDSTRARLAEAAKVLSAVAAECGVSQAQVLYRWALQCGYPVLPKSTKPERIKENIDLFGFELTGKHMGALAALGEEGDLPFAWNAGDPMAHDDSRSQL